MFDSDPQTPGDPMDVHAGRSLLKEGRVSVTSSVSLPDVTQGTNLTRSQQLSGLWMLNKTQHLDETRQQSVTLCSQNHWLLSYQLALGIISWRIEVEPPFSAGSLGEFPASPMRLEDGLAILSSDLHDKYCSFH